MAVREIIALVLAGGQGRRLGVLTKTVVKPAVLYGGKYRLIDFAISNCVNSGIDAVGVLTHCPSLKPNACLNAAKPWHVNGTCGGITIHTLCPRENPTTGYSGTANAVYQNISYVDKLSPRFVIILSGDHIYKMDYSLMLNYHKKHNSDATISVATVSLEEAERYGIISAYDSDEIYKFEEKPQNPESTLASMGVYIFTWDVLRQYLIMDNENTHSNHDFAQNIIPMMLKDGKNMRAYKFDSYWRDVGTIQTFWQSNMDLVKGIPSFSLFDANWSIYASYQSKSSCCKEAPGNVRQSVIAEDCRVYGSVRNSIVFSGVVIDKGAIIEDSIIMPCARIGKNTVISSCIIGERVRIGNNVKMGSGEMLPNELNPEIYNSGISVAGEGACIPDNAQIGRNVMIDTDVEEDDFEYLSIPSGKSVIKKAHK